MGISNKLFDYIIETDLYKNAYIIYAYAYKIISLKLTKYYNFNMMIPKVLTYDNNNKRFYYNDINLEIMENNTTQGCVDFSYYYYTFKLSKKFKEDYGTKNIPFLKKSRGFLTNNNEFYVNDKKDKVL